MKKINEDDTEPKANTISAHIVLPPLKISEFGDFVHLFMYYT